MPDLVTIVRKHGNEWLKVEIKVKIIKKKKKGGKVERNLHKLYFNDRVVKINDMCGVNYTIYIVCI